MDKYIPSLLYILLLCLVMPACHRTSNADTDEQEQTQENSDIREIRYEYGIPVDSFQVVEGTVKNGQTLGGILSSLGAGSAVVNQLVLIPRDSFDVRLIRPGKEYVAFYDNDSVLTYFVYKQSITQAVVLHLQDSLHIEKQQKEVTLVRKHATAKVESSLWNAFAGQGLPPQLAIELSEIYAWTIDFFGLQKGDSVRVVYDEQLVDSVSIGIGRIYASAFWHAGRMQYAYFFETDENKGYYDETGKNLRKAFLKAPLNYKRISSTFTYARKHPIYKTVRPHTGVDYAAPTGTPVVALGDGKVIEKGYKGGGGNTVKIRHNSTYTTAYLHLSKYGKGIEVGKAVEQGQVIGYVGSTGASTGPHLDFRVWKNGTPVNPLTLESPSADPVQDQYKAQFDSIVASYHL